MFNISIVGGPLCLAVRGPHVGVLYLGGVMSSYPQIIQAHAIMYNKLDISCTCDIHAK